MDSIQATYETYRKFHGGEAQRLGAAPEVLWKGGSNSQHLRFAQIVRAVPTFDGKEVLDVGCGFADLYDYLTAAGCTVRYQGVDLCEAMIEECRRRHPHCEFHLGGVLDLPAEEPVCDLAVASGIFGLRCPDWENYVVKTVRHMLALSREGVVMNFLSNFSQNPCPDSRYSDPAATLNLLMRNVSPWAVLLHDYRWNDFTVAVFRDQRQAAA